MKTVIAAVFLASCLATTFANVANAYNCRTSCYWIGDRQYCDTRCS
jgi:hypothetical protein